MASNLYQLAVAALAAAERESLTQFEDWLADFSDSVAGRPIRGDQVRENLRAESHLTGDGDFGDCSTLADFLKACLEEHARASSDLERYGCFGQTCRAHHGRGLRIERSHLPDALLRYLRSREMVDIVIERVLGESAREDLRNGIMSLEDVFSRLTLFWDSDAMTDDDRLGAGTSVFATFEHNTGAPRADASAMAQALGLPVRPGREEILIEVSYSTDSVRNHRFPTIADAGWTHEFQPSSEVAPDPAVPETCCGWTRPLGSWPPQPELVHENRSLKILSAPPRLVGRYTA